VFYKLLNSDLDPPLKKWKSKAKTLNTLKQDLHSKLIAIVITRIFTKIYSIMCRTLNLKKFKQNHTLNHGCCMNTVMDFIFDILIYESTIEKASKDIYYHLLCFGKITYAEIKDRTYPRTAQRTYYKWYYISRNKCEATKHQ